MASIIGTLLEGILVVGAVAAAGTIGYYYGWDSSIFEVIETHKEPAKVIEVVKNTPKIEWNNDELIRRVLGIDKDCGLPENIGESKTCEKQSISKLLGINFIGKPKKNGDGDMVFKWTGIESFSLTIDKFEESKDYPLGFKFTFAADTVTKDNANFIFKKVKENKTEEIFTLKDNTRPEYRIKNVGWGLFLEKIGETVIVPKVEEDIKTLEVEEGIVNNKPPVEVEEKVIPKDTGVKKEPETINEPPSWWNYYWNKFIASYSF